MKIITLPRDTDLKAARAHISILRGKTPSERAQMAMELSDSVRETSVAGIKKRHPDYSAEEVNLAVLRLSIGEDLFNRVNSKINLTRMNTSG